MGLAAGDLGLCEVVPAVISCVQRCRAAAVTCPVAAAFLLRLSAVWSVILGRSVLVLSLSDSECRELDPVIGSRDRVGFLLMHRR